ncbi:MAG: hypothetical protein ACLURP_03095 [Ruminococcus sp.]
MDEPQGQNRFLSGVLSIFWNFLMNWSGIMYIEAIVERIPQVWNQCGRPSEACKYPCSEGNACGEARFSQNPDGYPMRRRRARQINPRS